MFVDWYSSSNYNSKLCLTITFQSDLIHISFCIRFPHSQTKAYNQMIWYGFNMADTSNPPLCIPLYYVNWQNILHSTMRPPVNVKYHNYDALRPVQISSQNIFYSQIFFHNLSEFIFYQLEFQMFEEFKLFWGQKAITLEFWFNEHNFSANTNILSNTKCKINLWNMYPI